MSQNADKSVSFSAREVELISEIVADWLNEGIMLPPFESDLKDLLKKLGLNGDDSTPEIYPKTQERLSRHGVKK